MISLLCLPLIFFLFFNDQIKSVLKKRNIELIVPPVSDGAIPFPYIMFSARRNVSYIFNFDNELSQIDSFQQYYQSIVQHYPNEHILFELKIDKRCSYQMVINILDVIGDGKYNFILFHNILYVESVGSVNLYKYSKFKRNQILYHYNQLKSTIQDLSNSEQITLAVIPLVWCILLFVKILSIKKMYSVA